MGESQLWENSRREMSLRIIRFVFFFYLKLSLWMKPLCVTIQMKATEQSFHVVLFIMLCKVVLTFKSVDKTPVCDHSNES